jgi:hypothetical protein
LAIEFPEVATVNLVLQCAHLVAQLLHFVVVSDFAQEATDFIVSIQDRLAFGNGDLHVLENGLGFVQRRFLGQVTDGVAFANFCCAFEFGILPGHDPHQRGFTGTVGPQHSDLGTRVKGQPDVIEHNLLAVLFGQFFDLINVMFSIHSFDFRRCEFSLVFYSHSIVAGGLLLMS